MDQKTYPPTDEVPFCIHVEPGTHYMVFECYELVFYHDCLPHYHVKDYTCGTDVTSDLEKAQIYLSGQIKWDGCADLYFDEQENAALHFCGIKDARRISCLIERLYEIAKELIEHWSDK